MSQQEIEQFVKAAELHRKKVTASKKASKEFLVSVGVIPKSYRINRKKA